MTDTAADGAGIVGALLRSYAPLTGLVALSSIKRSRLPDSVKLPALVVAEVSQIERAPLVRGASVRTVDRVAVTGRFESDRQRTQIMQMVKDACAGKVGTIAGMMNVAIRPAGRGPDLDGPGDSFEKTQDFRVSYDAPTSLA